MGVSGEFHETYSCSVTFCKKKKICSCTEFRENPTDSLVPETRSQTGGETWSARKAFSFDFVKNTKKLN
jgi:hypothetical protein